MSTAFGRLVIGCLLVLACSTFAFGQQPSPMTMITLIKVKPDMRQEWIDLQKTEVMPAYKKAGVPSMIVAATALFGDSDEFTIVTPVQKLAEFDGTSPFVKALDQQGAARLTNKLRKLTVSTRRVLLRNRPDLSIAPDASAAPPKFIVITHVNTKPGVTQAYEGLLKNELLPALKTAGAKSYLVSQTVYGGSLTEYHTVVFRNSFADLDKPSELVASIGQAGVEKLLAKSGPMVDHVERYIGALMPDLSYFAGSPAAK
jgi:hypothetical protein